jgi:hypothetical protein
MKDKIKKAAAIVGHLFLDNCISVVFASAAFVAICESVRLWMRSFFAEYYELIFFFLLIAFAAGYLIGTCKLFMQYYERASEEYDKRKVIEEREIKRFNELEYRKKEAIYEAYIKGSFRVDIEDGVSVEEVLDDYRNPCKDWSHYLRCEVSGRKQIRISLNQFAKKFFKKHPELLDVVK